MSIFRLGNGSRLLRCAFRHIRTRFLRRHQSRTAAAKSVARRAKILPIARFAKEVFIVNGEREGVESLVARRAAETELVKNARLGKLLLCLVDRFQALFALWPAAQNQRHLRKLTSLLDNRNRTQKWDESPCTLR